MGALSHSDLRPLTVGEIFDRAVTLFVRNVPVFSTLYALISLPLIAAQVTIGNQASSVTQYIDAIAHPAKANAAHPWPAGALVFFVAAALFLVLTVPLVYACAGCCVADIQRHGAPNWKRAFLHSVKRLPSIWLALILGVIAAGGGAFVGSIPVALVGIAVAFAASGAGEVAVIVVAVVLGLVFMAWLVVLALIPTMAIYITTIEEHNPFRAFSVAMARIFSRAQFIRALQMALASAALYAGNVAIAFGVVGLSLTLAHSTMPAMIVNSCIGILYGGFLSALMAVYYFDTRLRNQGYDLQAEIDRLQSAQSA